MQTDAMKEARQWNQWFDTMAKELNINEAQGPDAKEKIAKHAAAKMMADKSKGGFNPKNFMKEEK